MTPIRLIVAGVVLLVVAILVTSAAFIVHQTEQAIVLRFGDPKQVVKEPGLGFKVPFIDDVTYFDARFWTTRHRRKKSLRPTKNGWWSIALPAIASPIRWNSTNPSAMNLRPEHA